MEAPRPISDPLVCDARCVNPDGVRTATHAVEVYPEAAAALFAALGDRTRLRLLAALRAAPLCTCDLAGVLGVSESAVSHQLRPLREAGLVCSERKGKLVIHSLADAHISELLDIAAEHATELAGPQ